nr:hypothetical protein [uncultured Cellulosilyticum sp.]
MNSKILNKKIRQLDNIRDIELARMEVYSVIVAMIFSKEEFRTNMEIACLMNSMGIDYREYVLKSRTMILSKVLRKIQKADEHVLRKYIDCIVYQHLINEHNRNQEIVKQEVKKENPKVSDNYMKQIIEKYKRNDK